VICSKTVIDAHGGLETLEPARQRLGTLDPGRRVLGAQGSGGSPRRRRRHGESARRASLAPPIRRGRPAQRVHIRTSRDRDRRRNRRRSPRPAAGLVLPGQTAETPWSMPQLAYFVGCAMWTYLTQPFTFTMPDFGPVSWSRGMKRGSAGSGCTLPGRATSPPTAPNRRCTSRRRPAGTPRLRRRDQRRQRAQRTTSPTTTRSRASGSPPTIGSSRVTPDGQSLDEPLIVSIDLSEIAFT